MILNRLNKQNSSVQFWALFANITQRNSLKEIIDMNLDNLLPGTSSNAQNATRFKITYEKISLNYINFFVDY